MVVEFRGLLYISGAIYSLFWWNVSGLCLFFVFSGRSFQRLGGIGCDGVGLVLVLGGSFWESLLDADSLGWLLLVVGYAFCSIRF